MNRRIFRSAAALVLALAMAAGIPASVLAVDVTEEVHALSSAHTYEGCFAEVGSVTIRADASESYVTAVEAVASGGAPGLLDAGVTATGNVTLTGDCGGTGAMASGQDGHASVNITGNVILNLTEAASGVVAKSIDTGSAEVTVGGDVNVATGQNGLYGVYASRENGADGHTTVSVGGDVWTLNEYGNTTGVYAAGPVNSPDGSPMVSVAGTVYATSQTYDAIGVIAENRNGSSGDSEAPSVTVGQDIIVSGKRFVTGIRTQDRKSVV